MRPAYARVLFPIALLLPLAACVVEDDDRASAPIRDSAGIRIIESTRPRWGPGEAWSVGAPAATIGATEGEPGHQLERVQGAVRLGDATIVIAEAGSRSLMRYDSTGRFLGASGRQGDGPGEFRALSWLGAIEGDSLLAWDRGLSRVTVFAPTGEYVREYRPTLTEHPMSLEVKGALSGGRLLLARGANFISATGNPGVQRQPITGWLVSPDGAETQSFGPFAGEAVSLTSGRTPNSTIRSPVPFGASTLFATHAGEVYVVDTEHFAVRVYSDSGRLERIIRKPHERLPVAAEDVLAHIEAQLENLPRNEDIRAGYRRMLMETPTPDRIPAIRSLRVDRAGYLWVEAGRRPTDENASWTVFHPDGVWLGDVSLPASLSVLEIGASYMLVAEPSDLDVPRVMLLPLRATRD